MVNFQESVKKVYGLWSSSYDCEENPALIAESDFSIKLAKIKQGELVLDFGCGTGRSIKQILSKTENVYGIDISKDMIDIAKKKYPSVKFIVNEDTGLPFENEYFDKIICNLVISHIKDLRIFLNEIFRILKLGGAVVISSIHPEANFSNYKMKKKRFELMKYDINIQYSINEIKKNLLDAGFNKIELKETYIDDKLKNYYTPDSFELIKGTPFLIFFKANK